MFFLHRMFASETSREYDNAKTVAVDETRLEKEWNEFLSNRREKREIACRIHDGSATLQDHTRLQQILAFEITALNTGLIDSKEVVKDIEEITHDARLKRLDKIVICLGHKETKYEYVHNLLEELAKSLHRQAYNAMTSAREGNDTRYGEGLEHEMRLEDRIIERIQNELKEFHKLFKELAAEKHLEFRMSKQKKAMVAFLKKRIALIFENETTKGDLYEWVVAVFNEIEYEIEREVTEGILEYDIHNLDYHYVNRQSFVHLVRDAIAAKRKRTVSEETVDTFVRAFREFYNHEYRRLPNESSPP